VYVLGRHCPATQFILRDLQVDSLGTEGEMYVEWNVQSKVIVNQLPLSESPTQAVSGSD